MTRIKSQDLKPGKTRNNRTPLNQALEQAKVVASPQVWEVYEEAVARLAEPTYGPGANLFGRMRSMPRADACSYTWQTICAMIDGADKERTYEHIDMEPDYQRPIVWTEAQQSAFVGHLLDGGECPKIYIQQYRQRHDLPSEIVDGKQRLTSIYRWMRGDIPAVCADGAVIWFKDTDVVDRRALKMELHMIDLPRAERLNFYLRLNRGGTVHTSEEIGRVREMLARETAT